MIYNKRRTVRNTPATILFICGSLNQTTMMHRIAQGLPEHHAVFTPYYGDGVVTLLGKTGLLDHTVAGRQYQERTMQYLKKEGLEVDWGGTAYEYDLVVTCSDLIVPKNIRHRKIVLVQEGMTDPEGLAYHLVRHLKLPRYLASTSTTGLSNAYVRFCVASEGYKEHFVRKGASASKITVTGIPNFDNCDAYRELPFPHRSFVLAALSDMRETLRYENRPRFIDRCLQIADGRKLIFKLHPNENTHRALWEIERYAPDALAYHSCDINPMIAHCDELVTRYSSVVYVAHALGKRIHSDLDPSVLARLAPLQNGGTRSHAIADVCREVLEHVSTIIPVQQWWRKAAVL
jgi:hypothetical protein